MEETKVEGSRFLDFLKRNELSLVAITALFLFCTLFYYVNSPYEKCLRFYAVWSEYKNPKDRDEQRYSRNDWSHSGKCEMQTHW